MYVSGTAYRSSESQIRRVSIDATNPDANHEVVVAMNTSANAMAVAKGTLYYIQVSWTPAAQTATHDTRFQQRTFRIC